MVIWMLALKLLMLVDSGSGSANNHGIESAAPQPSTNELATVGSRSETSRSATRLDHSSSLLTAQSKGRSAGFKGGSL